jgi:anthraniloyl-CoA monooxygenase
LYKALAAGDLPAALAAYEADRQPPVARFQEAARDSARYFEEVGQYLDLPLETFAFNLLTRSGRVTRLDLARRDPALTLAADRRVAESTALDLAVAPPSLCPIRIGRVSLANRLVGTGSAVPGAGMVMTNRWSVTPEGRQYPAAPVIDPAMETELGEAVAELARGGGLVNVVLGHDGPRASTRPPADGLDRPLRKDGWEIVSCSTLPYAAGHPPRALDRQGIERVVAAFSEAARVVGRTTADALTIDAAGGRLLASFLSPLTNQREDEYGGPIANRMRFPLLVVETVRAVWSGLLTVSIAATDWHRRGISLDEVIEVAEALRDRRNYLVGLAAGLKHRAGIPVLVGGAITSLDDADTAIAAARADLVRLDPHPYQRRLTRPLGKRLTEHPDP